MILIKKFLKSLVFLIYLLRIAQTFPSESLVSPLNWDSIVIKEILRLGMRLQLMEDHMLILFLYSEQTDFPNYPEGQILIYLCICRIYKTQSTAFQQS